ncbi:MAG: hypothetical protein MK008_08190 [Bdellovibrionales bacterium]|nr:hypothetical protein [Bdellovibrionales bacterium]
MVSLISEHIKSLEEMLYAFEVKKTDLKLSNILAELKHIRILCIEEDRHDLSKCVEFCFDKVKDWDSDTTSWGQLQIQFLYMTINMSKCLLVPNQDCSKETLAFKSTSIQNSSEHLASEGLDLLDRSLKMIYMCLSLKNTSMDDEKIQQMESYLKSELLHILKRKNSLKQHLHTEDSRSNIKAYA